MNVDIFISADGGAEPGDWHLGGELTGAGVIVTLVGDGELALGQGVL